MNPHETKAGDGLALYGSLMRGFQAMPSLGIIDRLRFVGPCVCAGLLFDLGDYPGICHGEAQVAAELYTILDPEVIKVLDEFEGFDADRPRESFYLRENVRLITPAETRAWIYLYNRVPDANTRITSGDWRAHLNSRQPA